MGFGSDHCAEHDLPHPCVHCAEEEWRILADDHKRIMAELDAAQAENERLSNRLSDAHLANDKLRDEMHDLREDHAYITGSDWMAKATDAERELAALRADDAGRVERVAREVYRNVGHQEGPWDSRSSAVRQLYCDVAKDVLAVADGKVKP